MARSVLSWILFTEAILIGVLTISLVAIDVLAGRWLDQIVGRFTEFALVLGILAVLIMAALFVAAMAIGGALDPRSRWVAPAVVVSAAAQLVVGLGQLKDLIQGLATSPGDAVALVVGGVALCGLSGALASVWWDLRRDRQARRRASIGRDVPRRGRIDI